MTSLYKLRDWIEKNKLDWNFLSKNIHIMHLLNEVPSEMFWMISDKINWYSLSQNPDAIELLKKNQDEIYWSMLANNKNISVNESIHYDSDDSDGFSTIDSKGNRTYISGMEYAKMLTEHNNQRTRIVMNPHVQYIEKPCELDLSKSTKIDWYELSNNSTDMHFLEQNQDKIIWYELSKNPNAILLLEKNKNKIDWKLISQNSSIFELNYDYIKKRMSIIKEELIAKAMHPNRIQNWIDNGINIDDL